MGYIICRPNEDNSGIETTSIGRNKTLEEVNAFVTEQGWSDAVVEDEDNLQSIDAYTIVDGSLTHSTTKEADIQLNKVRAERDDRLRECDWVAVRAADTGTAMPTEWATYRQALRDITNTATSLDDVVWPTKPS